MYVCTHTYMHAHTHTHTHTQHAHTHTRTYVHTHTCTHTCSVAHIHTLKLFSIIPGEIIRCSNSVCTYILCFCLYECVCVYVCFSPIPHTYVHTQYHIYMIYVRVYYYMFYRTQTSDTEDYVLHIPDPTRLPSLPGNVSSIYITVHASCTYWVYWV